MDIRERDKQEKGIVKSVENALNTKPEVKKPQFIYFSIKDVDKVNEFIRTHSLMKDGLFIQDGKVCILYSEKFAKTDEDKEEEIPENGLTPKQLILLLSEQIAGLQSNYLSFELGKVQLNSLLIEDPAGNKYGLKVFQETQAALRGVTGKSISAKRDIGHLKEMIRRIKKGELVI